jgi:response regulator RpfG family c-di-GMP phosphodiesterase
METVNQILLVDNQVASNIQTDSKIKKSGLANKVKIALNGGHALLYLEQVQEKLIDSSLVILLNMDTPIMNGYEFINHYNACKNLCRDKILLIILNDNLSEDRMNSLRKLGINNFINRDFDPQVLSGMIRKYFMKAPASVKMKNKLNSLDQQQSMRAA